MEMVKVKRVSKWYHGGMASVCAAMCTHPLDLLKVQLQTQQGKMGLVSAAKNVIRTDGIFGLYNGLSASILRQLTYSTTRFAIYETMKKRIVEPGQNLLFYQKVLLAGVSGFVGGVVGTPADMINVRMQNDVKLPLEQRRNYKNAVDGLLQVFRNEGPANLMNGVTMASVRAVFVTIGQLAFYDQYKQLLLNTGFFNDNLTTHFSASFLAGGTATTITMPLDVMKTRMMNAKPGMYSSIFDCAKDIARNGPLGFFKGFIPAFVRLGPHTILTFVFFEQIRLRFGDEVVIR